MKEIFRKHGSVSQYYMVQISGILITWFPRNWIFLGGCFICRTLYIQPRIFIILLVLSDYQMSICSCLHLFSASGFSIAAPKTWNSFLPALRMCTGPDTFRRHLKTHYFQQIFQSAWRLPSCTSHSASAHHCAFINHTCLLTYLLILLTANEWRRTVAVSSVNL